MRRARRGRRGRSFAAPSAWCLAPLLALGVGASGCVELLPGEAVARDFSGSQTATLGSPVLRVRWRRLLTEPELLEYKPQEFASADSDGQRVFVGSHGGWFYALSPGDGRVLWKKQISGGVSGQPLHSRDLGIVFVGGDDGVMYALDARSGSERWSYHAHGPLAAKPVYGDGVLYFTSGENRVYAVDAYSGAWRWQYERDAPEGFAIRGYGSPLLAGGRVYAGFSDGHVAALNARNGDVIWARLLAADGARFLDVDATPVIADGALYVASFSGGVYALAPADGAVRWRYEVEGAGTVRVDGERIYFTATRAGLHCLDTKGRLRWRQALARQGELSPPALLGDGLLFVSASEGGTYVVDRASGELRQHFSPGHGATAAPTSDGRQLYLLTNTGFFYAFALGTG